MTPTGSKASLDELLLMREIENFLYREAELLDERRYEEWLDLLSDDVAYWMPMRRNVKYGEWEQENTRPDVDMNWFDEDKGTLALRVRQIRTGVHWAEEPISRVTHVVSNVRLLEATPSLEQAGEVKIACSFIVYRNRQETETDFLVGRRKDTLRRAGDSWQIARREIMLDQNVLLAKTVTVFL